jgi:subtilase family serine protease
VFFSTGSGGGVSSFWPAPYYQEGYPGMRRTEAGQVVTFTDPTNPSATPQTLLTLPAHFEGRNVPDIAADADPYTGYLLYSSTDCAANPGSCDVSGFISGYGGTSFVAPQMNGVSALVKQRTGGRVGLWNPMLYRFAQGRRTSLEDVTTGDNWFYNGVRGYEPASGLGALDVNKFANAVAAE